MAMFEIWVALAARTRPHFDLQGRKLFAPALYSIGGGGVEAPLSGLSDLGRMPSNRSHRAPTSKPAATRREPSTKELAPTFSRRGLFRLGVKTLGACAIVGTLTLVAGWHSAGLVRSGEIDRMLRMSASLPRPVAADAKSRGKLDRGHLNALVATAAK